MNQIEVATKEEEEEASIAAEFSVFFFGFNFSGQINI
jgi:hypothetical protein